MKCTFREKSATCAMKRTQQHATKTLRVCEPNHTLASDIIGSSSSNVGSSRKAAAAPTFQHHRAIDRARHRYPLPFVRTLWPPPRDTSGVVVHRVTCDYLLYMGKQCCFGFFCFERSPKQQSKRLPMFPSPGSSPRPQNTHHSLSSCHTYVTGVLLPGFWS